MEENLIVVRTMNPADVTTEEVEHIAAQIRAAIPTTEIRVEGHDRTGTAATWFEVVRIGLEFGASIGVGKAVIEEVARKITDIFIDWARERFKGRKSNSRRPVYINIYGPDGTVKSTVIKNATNEPEDRTEEDRKRENPLEKK